jgi:hypothetical protein
VAEKQAPAGVIPRRIERDPVPIGEPIERFARGGPGIEKNLGGGDPVFEAGPLALEVGEEPFQEGRGGLVFAVSRWQVAAQIGRGRCNARTQADTTVTGKRWTWRIAR